MGCRCGFLDTRELREAWFALAAERGVPPNSQTPRPHHAASVPISARIVATASTDSAAANVEGSTANCWLAPAIAISERVMGNTRELS